MSEIFESVKSAFSESNWNFHEVAGHEVLEADFDAHHTRVALHVQVFPVLNAVSVVARGPNPVPDSHTGVICELLMRANQMLSVGNFEFDFAGAVVLFRSTNLFSADRADQGIITGLVHSSVAEMDRITPCVAILIQTPPRDLPGLNLNELLHRDDLLPPSPIPARLLRPDAAAVMPDSYYIVRGALRNGPFSESELIDLVKQGRVAGTDLCQREGESQPRSIGALFEFFEQDEPADEPVGVTDDPLSEYEGPPRKMNWEDDTRVEPEADSGAAQRSGGAVLLSACPSVLSYSGSLMLGFGALAAGWLLASFNSWFLLGGITLFTLCVAWVAFHRSRLEFIVSRRRIEIIYGLVTKSSKEVRVSDIRAINVRKRGLLGLIGVGDVEFLSAGSEGVDVAFKNIWNPHRIKRLVRSIQDGRESIPGPASH